MAALKHLLEYNYGDSVAASAAGLASGFLFNYILEGGDHFIDCDFPYNLTNLFHLR